MMLRAFVAAALVFSGSAVMADPAIDAKYEKSCKLCHATGLLNAPKTGDQAAWAPRMAQGDEVLLKHIKDGFNQMPPKGTCMDCTDEEFLALTKKMAGAN